MAQRRPPDQDPDLREAFSLNAVQQRALLESMFGTSTANPAVKAGFPPSWTFTPLDAPVRRRPSGALVWLPRRGYGPEPPLNATEPKLLIRICHQDLVRRQQPRLREAVAELEALIARHASRLGIVTLPFAAPERWTTIDIRGAFAAMARALPEWPGRGEAHLSINGSFGHACGSGRTHLLCEFVDVEAPPDLQGYFATVELPAIPFNPNAGWCGTFAKIDAEIGKQQAKANPAKAEQEDNDNDDEDDLDAFERAARRRLHGERGLSPTQRRRHVEPDAAPLGGIPRSLVDKLRIIARSRPWALKVLENMADRAIELEG